jgi:hypothetical protein
MDIVSPVQVKILRNRNAREVGLLLERDVEDERHEAHVHDGLDDLERLVRRRLPDRVGHGDLRSGLWPTPQQPIIKANYYPIKLRYGKSEEC